jgi:amphi-Trp domain-containing protein
MKKNKFRYDLVTDPLDVARYLESLIDGFRRGELSFSDQNRQIALKPAEIMELSIEASRRQGRVSLAIALRWNEREAPKQLSLAFDRQPENETPQNSAPGDPNDPPV